MSTRKLLFLYRKSTELRVRSSGMNWYLEAHKFALRLASTYGIGVDKAAGVISALSPMITWEQNKIDAEILISGWSAGVYVHDQNRVHNFSTYSKNVNKAEQILFTDQPVENFFSLKTGPKTLHFYLNILHPTKNTGVTIDRHVIAAWEGIKDGSGGSRRVTAHQYKKIESGYVSVANKVGILPHQLQAIIWVTYKQLNNL